MPRSALAAAPGTVALPGSELGRAVREMLRPKAGIE
jgi:hypothetical protein